MYFYRVFWEMTAIHIHQSNYSSYLLSNSTKIFRYQSTVLNVSELETSNSCTVKLLIIKSHDLTHTYNIGDKKHWVAIFDKSAQVANGSRKALLCSLGFWYLGAMLGLVQSVSLQTKTMLSVLIDLVVRSPTFQIWLAPFNLCQG